MLAAHPSPQLWDGTPPALRNTVQGFVPQDRPDLQVVVLALVEPAATHHPLEGEAALLGDALGGNIAGVDVQLHPVDALATEYVPDQQPDRVRGVPAARVLVPEQLVGDLIPLKIMGDREVLDLADDLPVLHRHEHAFVGFPEAVLGERGSERGFAHHAQREVGTSGVEVRHQLVERRQVGVADRPQLDHVATKHQITRIRSRRVVLARPTRRPTSLARTLPWTTASTWPHRTRAGACPADLAVSAWRFRSIRVPPFLKLPSQRLARSRRD